MDGNIVREEQLDPYVFGAPVNVGLLHQVVTSQLVNRRQGNASTKTRSEVSGGGKKPYRQKGTGRARQGSPRAPQWRTGGTVFGPQPHSYERKVPRKMRRIAIRAALSDKAANGRILLMDELVFDAPHTSEMENLLQNLPLERHVLLLMPARDENVIHSAHNIQRVKLGHVDSTNVIELLKYEHLLMPLATVTRLIEMFGQEADDALALKRHPLVVARHQARRAALEAAHAKVEAKAKPAGKTRAKASDQSTADVSEAETPSRKPATKAKESKETTAESKATSATRTSKAARPATSEGAEPTETDSQDETKVDPKSSERSTRGKSRGQEE
jgi:large subunit ribosomal protein L4